MPEPGTDNWRQALMTLVASRIALFRLEARQTARQNAARMARIAAAVICLLLAWALLVTGGIGLIASTTGWPWHWLAMAAAAIHLVTGLILIGSSSGASTPAFPMTRAEFQKDREWIENIQKNPKSNS